MVLLIGWRMIACADDSRSLFGLGASEGIIFIARRYVDPCGDVPGWRAPAPGTQEVCDELALA
ncbi:MAG: hypothetical protein ACP5P4_05475 [Steroidobacteraceae bacterium]